MILQELEELIPQYCLLSSFYTPCPSCFIIKTLVSGSPVSPRGTTICKLLERPLYKGLRITYGRLSPSLCRLQIPSVANNVVAVYVASPLCCLGKDDTTTCSPAQLQIVSRILIADELNHKFRCYANRADCSCRIHDFS